MVGDRVLDDLQKLLLGVDRSNREAMKKLDHETSESLEGTRNANRRANFDENSFGSMNVDLKLSCLVDRRVKESKETLKKVTRCLMTWPQSSNLVGDIWSGIADITVHLAHHTDMLVTVQQ